MRKIIILLFFVVIFFIGGTSSLMEWNSEEQWHRRPTDQKQQSLISYTEDDQTAEDEADGKPKFFAGPWTDCSASCGTGIRSRLVECMGGGLRLPDYECQGQPRPTQFQPCSAVAPCPVAMAKSSPIRSLSEPFGFSKPSEAGFRWEHDEWTRCSASCLGGKQKAPVICMDVARRVHVPWTNCDAARRPQELTRACNRHACAPEWEIGPWSDCSHACGAGLRTRRVRCARAVSRSGAARTLIVPDAQCVGQRPGDEEPCGMVDCAPEWLTGHWGQCSASCGSGGEQRRPLRCVRRDSLGQVLDLEDAECRTDQRPATVRLCNMGPCPTSHAFSYEEGPFGVEVPKVASPQSLALTQSKDEPMTEDGEEEAEEHPHHRKLTLKVGGFANLYEGTSVKVKCPVKDNKSAGRRRVVWSRDGHRIENSPHVKVSANGALRIFHAQMADAGVYACHTVDGRAQGNVTLRFKPGGEPTPRRKTATNRTTKQQRESQKSMELLQRVRNNLYRLGQHSLLQRLTTVSDPAQVRVDFAASAWAECRQLECGHGEGVQVRLLKCQIHIGTDAAYVGDDICEAFGIPRPPATRPCTDERCPRWQSGPWSDCAESRCVRHATALQRREVRCMHANNGTLAADASLCDRRSRPKLKRECENANCSAEWRPSVWGACSKRCGDGGVQMRLLRCVWHGTRKPAGRACEPEARPSAIRACDRARGLPPCPEDEDAENETRKKNNGENSASNDGEDEEEEGTEESVLGEDTLTHREIGTDEERVEIPETESNVSGTQSDASGVGTLANESGNGTQDDESGTGTQADLSGNTTQSDASRAELQAAVDASGNGTRLRDELVLPFVGWQRWRGWRLYGWRPPTHFGGVSDASGDGGMRRRF